jgi:hypothetical protein
MDGKSPYRTTAFEASEQGRNLGASVTATE